VLLLAALISRLLMLLLFDVLAAIALWTIRYLAPWPDPM
jgi:hypothetical protein